MILGMEHTGIMVSNMEKSVSFYEKVIGLEVMDRFFHPNGIVELAFLGCNGKMMLELIAGYPAELPAEGKVHHFAFAVKGIEEETDRLKKLGVPFKDQEPTELPNGKYIFFFGPDGESLEFFESK